MRRYNSFEEIDRDLRYLKLQAQIDQEEFKLSLNNTQNSFTSALSPLNVIANLFGAVAKKAIVLKTIDKLFGFKKVKKKNVE